VSLRAVFYYLIKTPAAYGRLVAEIDEAEKKGQLSEYIKYEECLKLPYLYVSTRRFPPSPLLRKGDH
jgi:hypothetical protein